MPFKPPLAPTGLIYSQDFDLMGNTAVAMSWTGTGLNGSFDISGYNIYRSTGPVFEGVSPDYVTYTAFVDTVPNTGTRYYYEIRSVDTQGNTSDAAVFNIFITGPPLAPSGLTITAYNSVRADISWEGNFSGEAVSSYTLYRNGSEYLTQAGVSYSDYPLTPGTEYYYSVYAENSFGAGEMSYAVTITTRPAAPSAVTVTSGEDPGTLLLSWAANNAEENITEYEIFRATEPAFDYLSPLTTTLGTEIIDSTVLTASGYYFYTVAAVTENASNTVSGRYSEIVSAMPVTLPAVPENVTASARNTSALISWDMAAPAYGVYGYKVYRSTDAASFIEAGQPQENYYYDYGLTNNTLYYYKVTSLNHYGYSSASLTVTVVPVSGTVPAKILGASADGTGNNSVSLAWSAAPSYEQVLYYNIYRSTEAGTVYPVYMTLAAAAYSDISVSAGTQYFYKISAVNSAGEGDFSDEKAAIPYKKPGAPVIVSAVNLDGCIMLDWQPAELEPHTFYSGTRYFNIYRTSNPDTIAYSAVTTAVQGTGYMDCPESAAAAYYYIIREADDMGNESGSSDAVSVSGLAPMSAPQNLVALPGNSLITLYWTKTTPSFYNIYRSTSAESFGGPFVYSSAVFGSNTKEYADSSVVNGTRYYYVIASVNDAGEGPWSVTVSAVPYVPASLPSSSSVKHTIQDKKNVFMEFNPSTDGTYEVTGYKIYRSIDGGGSYTTIGLSLIHI